MFERERHEFLVFRDGLAQQPVVREQMERAIEDVFWTYDTSIPENRFIVGGVIEYVLGAAMRACSVLVRHRGVLKMDEDLLFDDSENGYSVKAILKGTGTRLVNVMGAAPTRARWHSATIFLIPDLGLVYADPALEWWTSHLEECIRPSSDALTVSVRCIRAFVAECPEWQAPCKLPQESNRPARTHPARTASGDIAAQVLMHYETLFAAFAGLKPWEESRNYLTPFHD
ncbi:MAG: hypothetical protein WBK94_10490 [Tenuifilaceae bacterium]|jgi:hypothetical protein